MKSSLLYGKRDLRVVDVSVPVPAEGDILMKIEACGVCPGDVRAWTRGRTAVNELPTNLGHEATGTIVEVGSKSDSHLIGRRVFGDGFGGYAEYKLISASSLQLSQGPTFLPDDLSFEVGVFVEPLADCLHAVEYCAQSRFCTSAAVIGCGQMGLQIVRLCVLAGLRVIACDPLAQRRQIAASFGAERVVQSTDREFEECALDISNGRGLDCAFLVCADPMVMTPALRCLAMGGRCVLFSGYEENQVAVIAPQLIHEKRLQIVGSRWVSNGATPFFQLYRRAAEQLSRGLLDTNLLIGMRATLSDMESAFQAFSTHAVLKAVIFPG